jgi:hypothetical protein
VNKRAVERVAVALSVIVLTVWATDAMWPRPSLVLRVERGGVGVVVHRWGRNTPLPDTLFVRARGRNTGIRIENRDTAYQTLGILGVPAGTERNFTLPLPGAYSGYCSAHPTGKTLTYVVQ